MHYLPNAEITIGNILFENVDRVEIRETVRSLGNSAMIRLPRNYKELEGKDILEILKPEDPISIKLGYDGEFHEEFKGYLQYPESDAPLILHCDDEFYPLKRNNYTNTFAEGTPLKDILSFVAPGYEIVCPDVKLSKFEIPGVSTYKVLKAIMEQYGFYAKLDDKTLKCMWPYEFDASTHTYEFYTPTVKRDNLKYHRAEDVNIRLQGISNLRNGNKIKVLYPPGAESNEGSLETRNYVGLTKNEVTELLKKEHQRLAFDGFSGSITGYGTPKTKAGDTLKLVNKQEADKQGSYLIDDVKIVYDLTVGYERENHLSFKVA